MKSVENDRYSSIPINLQHLRRPLDESSSMQVFTSSVSDPSTIAEVRLARTERTQRLLIQQIEKVFEAVLCNNEARLDRQASPIYIERNLIMWLT